MSLEHQNAPCGDPGTGEPGRAPPGAEGWGWALVQRDWSLRQREPSPARAAAGIRGRIGAVIAWLGRVAGAVLRGLRISPPGGGGSGTPRSSARPSSSRGC
jgi:hypothetical protein